MSSLERVVALTQTMEKCAADIVAIKGQLEDAQEAFRRIEQEDLPELMRELGLDLVRLENGTTVSVDSDVQCAITEANRPAAHAWLVKHGFDGLIKTEVVRAFGRGELAEAQELAGTIGGALTEKVHPATLKAFVKEQMQAGQVVPFDLFSVFPFNRAKLKKAK